MQEYIYMSDSVGMVLADESGCNLGMVFKIGLAVKKKSDTLICLTLQDKKMLGISI